MTHTIYHIPGVKVGCAANFERRVQQYPVETKFEIIEVLEGFDDRLAGDREWDWADWYGYPRGPHYITHWGTKRDHDGYVELGKNTAANLGEEGRSKRSLTAAKTRGHEAFVKLWRDISDGLGEAGRRARSLKVAAVIGHEGCVTRAKKGHVVKAANGKSASSQKAWDTRRKNGTTSTKKKVAS